MIAADEHRRPQQIYAEAVADIDGPGGWRAPEEWITDRTDDGLLVIQLWYRRTAPREATGAEMASMPDRVIPATRDVHGEQLTPAMVPPLVEAWQWGITVSWDDKDGWHWAPLVNEFSEVDEHGWEKLPVPLLASPKALHTVLAELFAGREYDLPAQVEQWSPNRPDTLIDYVAAPRQDRAAAAPGGRR